MFSLKKSNIKKEQRESRGGSSENEKKTRNKRKGEFTFRI